jgi:hypothetical protein
MTESYISGLAGRLLTRHLPARVNGKPKQCLPQAEISLVRFSKHASDGTLITLLCPTRISAPRDLSLVRYLRQGVLLERSLVENSARFQPTCRCFRPPRRLPVPVCGSRPSPIQPQSRFFCGHRVPGSSEQAQSQAHTRGQPRLTMVGSHHRLELER